MRLPTKKIEGKSVSFHGLTSISTRIDKFPSLPSLPNDNPSDFDSPISIRTNELVRVHSGKVIIIIIKYGEKKRKENK